MRIVDSIKAAAASLEDFVSESSLPTATGPIPPAVPVQAVVALEPTGQRDETMTSATPRTFSLDHILAREIPVHWDEAVAVIEELCTVLTSGSGEALPVPDLGDILITADGAVMVQRGARGTTGASGAGRTLHELLSTADVPVALRLFVTQATSSDTYPSLREFATALAYFGKPGRAALIRAIYERCAAGGVASATPAREHPPTPQTKAKPDTKEPERPRRFPAWVAVAAGVACVLGGGMWFWSTTRGGTGAGTVPSLLAQTKNAIQELGTEVRSVLGVGAAPAQRSAATSPPAKASRPRTTRPRPDASRATVIPSEPVQLAPPLELAPVVVAADAQVAVEAFAPADDVPEGERLIPVYSSTDLDVRPALLLYPQLPPPLLAERRAGVVNSMELVVSESGTVVQVRLIDGPRRMPDMMLLSGAKMWKFRPAVKDGEPVRYRTVVSWSGIP